MTQSVAMLAAETSRARAYLDVILESDIVLEDVIFLDGSVVKKSISNKPTPLFDNATLLENRLISEGISYKKMATNNMNAPEVVAALEKLESSFVITAGPPGALLRTVLFETGKKFLHVHPGKLPQFRGSTPMYYSVLTEKTLTATAMVLDLNLDAGEIITEKDFALPQDMLEMDHFYDPWIRSVVLKEALSLLATKGKVISYPQQSHDCETWYVIHPLLKHLAIMSEISDSE
ncbi:formyltransferase family protein [Kiloniella majae]|uniref:formyltransferase family protein n=1 Tax=Kiloniella majae TaxID=1938558 RepID=UPI000A27727A|nr:formyltransferase family protein [Kiloniella majae]